MIDNYVTYAQSLIDDFSQKDKAPHIAISVDMLDTGIDVPEIANLVFFKPVYSKIKFWQMIGRGTRLCPDLFGPDDNKQDFRVFDFCFNFDFFKEKPEGIKASDSPSLGTQLFRSRVQLLGQVQTNPELDENASLKNSLTEELFDEVISMNRQNFIVGMHLEAVYRFQQQESWERLSNLDMEVLQREVAGLPSEREKDDTDSLRFDLIALRMQLALIEGNHEVFEKQQRRVMEIAMLLEEKTSIPAVDEALDFLSNIQESSFWEGMNLAGLEEMRLRLRGLVPFIDKKERKVVYTDFKDEVTAVHDEVIIPIPKMTSEQYEKKVKDYLNANLNHIAIHRLRTNRQLTENDLEDLEANLVKIGEEEGESLLSVLLARSDAPSLKHFVRSLVGLDQAAVQEAFSEFLGNRSLTSSQIRFIEMIIDQLTKRGVMKASALYEQPFVRLHSGGPDELFSGQEEVLEGIFDKLRTLNSEL